MPKVRLQQVAMYLGNDSTLGNLSPANVMYLCHEIPFWCHLHSSIRLFHNQKFQTLTCIPVLLL